MRRGLEPALARQVAQQLTLNDPLKAHARDELGLSDELAARPLQAALASAAAFAVGAVLPIIAVLLAPVQSITWIVATVSLVCLAALGAVAARTGGSPLVRSTARVAFWGALAMAVTAGIGRVLGTVV